MTRVVVALGGNALLGDHGMDQYSEQLERVEETANHVAEAMAAGNEVVLTHGNGPQVGTLMLQQERAPDTPQLPLDVLVAETQAQIGYLLQRALDSRLPGQTDFITVVTQVLVDPEDPAFDDPRKPVGPFYTPSEAEAKAFRTAEVGSGENPFRRVVPSPAPIGLVESEEIRRLVDGETHVICAGGGGVPVTAEDEVIQGVEAVVDKDLTSALLATDLDASLLVILTDVPNAYRAYDSDDPEPITDATPSELRMDLESGEFGSGSMAPKVKACIRFIERGGERAVITTPDSLLDGIAGKAGTQVRPG